MTDKQLALESVKRFSDNASIEEITKELNILAEPSFTAPHKLGKQLP